MEQTEQNLNRIFDELSRRISHIGIALNKQIIKPIQISEHYDLSCTSTPSIGETEDAFKCWNCAILTAFRGSKDLSPEMNFQRNIKRNEELKANLVENNLMFRSVNGCYREAGMDKPDVELCFFVTNTTDQNGDTGNSYEFFSKVYKLAEQYEQDSFLYTFPGINRVAFLVATNDNGRKEFRGDIKFAGPLYTHVPDWDAWTDCSDGRISFKLLGMILLGGTGNKKIKIGEGNIFDVDGYKPDGLGILRYKGQKDLLDACKRYSGNVPLVTHYFKNDDVSEANIRNSVLTVLKELSKLKVKNIGFHCSVPLYGSYVDGAKAVLGIIQEWAKNNDKQFNQIVLVDIYGDYSK